MSARVRLLLKLAWLGLLLFLFVVFSSGEFDFVYRAF